MCMTEMILYSSFTGLLKQNEPQGFFFCCFVVCFILARKRQNKESVKFSCAQTQFALGNGE